MTDTGVLYAALVVDDVDHVRCRDLLAGSPSVTIPTPVINELEWLGRTRGRPELGGLLLDSVLDGSIIVAELDGEGWSRVRDLVARYLDLPLGVVDASVVATAERMEETVIATLDRRHFSVVKPVHARGFRLLPD